MNTQEDVRAIAGKLTKSERACIANWGDRKTPVPDSIWHGALSHLKRCGPDGKGFILSPIGLAVKAHLQSQGEGGQ